MMNAHSQSEISAFQADVYEEGHMTSDFQKKRYVKFANKEETKGNKLDKSSSATRQDFSEMDVTELITSDRDSKTGKRFKVFSPLISHPYGTLCQFSSKDKGVTY